MCSSDLGPFDMSKDGRFLVAAQFRKGVALIFDLQNPSAAPLSLYHSNAFSVAVSPEGRYVATAGNSLGTKVWERQSGQVLAELPGTSAPRFSPDGRWLGTGGAGGNRLYRVGSWDLKVKVAVSSDDYSGPFCFSPNGELWAIGNPLQDTHLYSHLYSTVTGRRLAILEAPHPALITSLAFSPDGATLGVIQRDHVVQLWDLREIRQQLAALKLDWELPSYGPPTVQQATQPVRVELRESSSETARKAFLTTQIPSRPESASAHQLDLSSFYNAAFTESWHERTKGNDLSELQPGFHKLADVLFDVRGLIQVGGLSGQEPSYPFTIYSIPVNQLCARLHFLHSAIFAGNTPTGKTIGSYLVHYVDGRYEYVPIVIGKDVLDWFSQPQEELSRVVVAWSGHNEKSRRSGQVIRLFKSTWNNPFPSVPVSRIDFSGSGMESAKPFLVAITTE